MIGMAKSIEEIIEQERNKDDDHLVLKTEYYGPSTSFSPYHWRDKAILWRTRLPDERFKFIYATEWGENYKRCSHCGHLNAIESNTCHQCNHAFG